MNIERQPQESLMDYHKRLIYGKLVDRTLADVDYVELSEKVYGQPYSNLWQELVAQAALCGHTLCSG